MRISGEIGDLWLMRAQEMRGRCVNSNSGDELLLTEFDEI